VGFRLPDATTADFYARSVRGRVPRCGEGLRWRVHDVRIVWSMPLAMMSRRPVPDGPLARATVVSLFGSGLISLLAYILWSIRRLTADVSASPPS
jgi:hypothetical protein